MPTLSYEKQACGLCGGSGRDAYTFGAACRRCAGRKLELSPAAKRAQKKLVAWLDENASLPVDALSVGDAIEVDGAARVIASVDVIDDVRPHAIDEGKTFTVRVFFISFEDGHDRRVEHHPSMKKPVFRIVADDETVEHYYAFAAKLKGVDVKMDN